MGTAYSKIKEGKEKNQILSVMRQNHIENRINFQEIKKNLLIQNICYFIRNTNSGSNTKVIDHKRLLNSSVEELQREFNDILIK